MYADSSLAHAMIGVTAAIEWMDHCDFSLCLLLQYVGVALGTANIILQILLM